MRLIDNLFVVAVTVVLFSVWKYIETAKKAHAEPNPIKEEAQARFAAILTEVNAPGVDAADIAKLTDEALSFYLDFKLKTDVSEQFKILMERLHERDLFVTAQAQKRARFRV